jgi:tripartite-type tricarboxylate transporter receptor subunit TctC
MLPMPSSASTYPERSVRIFVGFPAGSSPDIVARTLASALSKRLGQSFVVEPRPGAGSNIATELALRAEPDGYTLLLCSGSNAWNATLYDRLPFNFLADAAPISGVYRGPSVLVVHPSVPAKTIAEFISYAKSKPGVLNMASNGNGSVGHVYGSLFKILTQVDMVHVPFRDNPLPDLLDGRTNVYFSPMGSAIEFIRAGRLRALGVTSVHRWDGLPDVPAIGEVVDGFEATGWMGMAAPRLTPPDVIRTLNKATLSSLQDPTVRKRIGDLGGEPFPGSPEEFGGFMRDFTNKWGAVIRTAGIKLG